MRKPNNDKKKMNANPWLLRLLGMGNKYFVKTPVWLMNLFPKRTWRIRTDEKIIYLTFDDGPHPEASAFVMDEMKKYNGKVSFFCIGKNVVANPHIYKRMIEEGHSVGNHSYLHLNGWKTDNQVYLSDITEAARLIDSPFFRPPYGRIRASQAKKIKQAMGRKDARIIMWDVLSGDFDEEISPEQCKENVIQNAGPGSIVVFHDSISAFGRLKPILPDILSFFAGKGYVFRSL